MENMGIPPIHAEIKDYIGRTITFTEVGKKLEKLSSKSVRRMMDLLVVAANNIRNDMISGMENTPKTGNKYFKRKQGKKKLFHIASSPGNFPAVDSGNLANSIIMDARFNEVEVGSIIIYPAYPKFLEAGTSRMEKRPWVKPVYDNQEPKIKKAAARLMDEILAEIQI